MEAIKPPVLLSLFSLLLTTVILSHNAAAGHNTCRVKAVNESVYVRIFDVDRAGNIIPDGGDFLSNEIWKGWLQEGESKEIKSVYGRIRYSYKASSDFRTQGNNMALCIHDETIRLP